MKRRNFLHRLFTGASLAVVPVTNIFEHKNRDVVDALRRKKYGYLNVESHRAHKAATGEDLYVYVDGRDVTRNCREADDINGYAVVLCRDEQFHRDLDAHGALHVDAGIDHVCVLKLRGDVVIKPGPSVNNV